MKFKVGDKARVITLDKVLSICEPTDIFDDLTFYRIKNTNGLKQIEKDIKIRTDMNLGKIVTITNIYSNEYKVQESDFFYVDWMLEDITKNELDIEQTSQNFL